MRYLVSLSGESAEWVYENKVLKRDDIVKYKVFHKEPHYLCFSLDMVEMTKLRGYSHVGHVACEV